MKFCLSFSVLGTALLALAGSAQAVSYNFGASVAAQAAQPFTVRAGVSDILLGGNRLSLAASNKALEVSLVRNQPLLVLGTFRLGASGALAYSSLPGARLGAQASGSIGPVALSSSALFWNTSAAALDPLSIWNQAAVNPALSGAQANLQAKYRPSRNLIVTLDGQLGSQSTASLSGEWRNTFYSYRLGALGGQGVVAALAGLTYRAESFTLSADAVVGRTTDQTLAHSGLSENTFGGSLLLDAPVVVPLSADQALGLSAYINYEPWRTAALPLRYGIDVDVPLGLAVDGKLNVGVRGGSGGIGVQAGYTFSPGGLDAEPDQP